MPSNLFPVVALLIGSANAFSSNILAKSSVRHAASAPLRMSLADVLGVEDPSGGLSELSESSSYDINDILTGTSGKILANGETDLFEDGLSNEEVADFGPRQPYVNQQALIAQMDKWRRHESDVGSPEVQIAQAHERIIYLTAHMQRNRKDQGSKRGLVAIVNKRRKLLNYLYSENPEKAMEMVEALGIRFTPRSKIQSRAEKYAVYNQASAAKKMKEMKAKA